MEQTVDYLRLMQKMTDVVAHDIRNPLNNILLSTAQFKMDILPDKEDTAFYVDIIERNCDRIHALLAEISGVLHLQGLNPGTFDVTELVLELLEEQKERMELKEIGWETGLKEVVVAHFDRDKLKAALSCVLENALEASAAGQKIVVAVREDREQAIVLIRDAGPGIEAAIRPFIFAPFFTTKTRNKGLGLTLVKNVLDAHSGQVQLDTGPEGSSFTLSFPLKMQVQQ